MVGTLGLFLAQYLGWGKRGLNYVKMRESQVGLSNYGANAKGLGPFTKERAKV